VVLIDQSDLDALLVGKGIAFNDGEYTHAIYLRDPRFVGLDKPAPV
jgi:hypothetical protein